MAKSCPGLKVRFNHVRKFDQTAVNPAATSTVCALKQISRTSRDSERRRSTSFRCWYLTEGPASIICSCTACPTRARANQSEALFHVLSATAPKISNASPVEIGRQTLPLMKCSASRNRGSKNAHTRKDVPKEQIPS